MQVVGFEEFGVRSLAALVRLGERRVTVGVSWSTPSLKELLRLDPRQRRNLVSKTYRRNLKLLLDALPRAVRVQGMRALFYVRADALRGVPDIPGLGPLHVTEIEGRRKRKTRPVVRTYSVRVRMVEEIAGKRSGYQHIQERIVTLLAPSWKEAERKALRHFRKPCYTAPYAMPSGEPVRWRIDRTLGVRPVVLNPLEDGVTTVWAEGLLGKLDRKHVWKV
jgi:hypothetical protein